MIGVKVTLLPNVLIVNGIAGILLRSEEHTSELQSLTNLVCRLLLEKKKKHITRVTEMMLKDQGNLPVEDAISVLVQALETPQVVERLVLWQTHTNRPSPSISHV